MLSDSEIQSSWEIKVNSNDGYVAEENLLSSDTIASFVERINERIQIEHGRKLGRIRIDGVIIPYHWTAYEVTSLLGLLKTDDRNLDEVVTAEKTTMALPKASGTSYRHRSRSR